LTLYKELVVSVEGLEKMFVFRLSSDAWVDFNVVNVEIVLEYLSGETREKVKPYT